MSIEELQPHRNLKWLIVNGSGRLEFPSSVSSFANLVALRIDSCKNCQRFPLLDQFPSLKRMEIVNLTDLEYIEQSNKMSGLFFPSLEKLWLSSCPNLKRWWRRDTATAELLLQFHCLVYLAINSCPNLSSIPLIPSVESLVVKNTSIKPLEDILKVKISMEPSTSSSSLFSDLPQLKILGIRNIEDLEFLPEELMQNLTSLKQLDIADCPLTTLSRALRHLTSLEVLIISTCERLNLSDDDNENENDSGCMLWQCLRSLQGLQFKNIMKLVSVPKGLQHVPNLRKHTIESCINLISLQEWMLNLTSLQYLCICNCQLNGDDWHMMAHIPNIQIDGT